MCRKLPDDPVLQGGHPEDDTRERRCGSADQRKAHDSLVRSPEVGEGDEDLFGEKDGPDKDDIRRQHRRNQQDVCQPVLGDLEEEWQGGGADHKQKKPGCRDQYEIVTQERRVDRLVPRDPAHEAFRCPQSAEMHGDVGKSRYGNEEAELIHAEEASEDGEGEELCGRADDQAAARCGIGCSVWQEGPEVADPRRVLTHGVHPATGAATRAEATP